MEQLLQNSNLLCDLWLHYWSHNALGVLVFYTRYAVMLGSSHTGMSDYILSFQASEDPVPSWSL